MKFKGLILIILSLILTTNIFAQQNQPNLQDPQRQIILKPTVVVDDLAFAFTTLGNVEIVGNEVESFLACKVMLEGFIKTAQTSNKKPGDTMVVEMPLLTAQNLLNLLSRARITGAQAEQYKRFVDAVVESGKNLRNQTK